MNQKSTWVQNPTKQQFFLSILVYVVGVTLIILSMSNLIEENFNFEKFHFKFNYLFFLLIVFSTTAVAKVIKNYFTNSKQK